MSVTITFNSYYIWIEINNPDNYRGIATSSVLGKLLEKIIMTKYYRIWHTNKQQFGFEAGHGSDMSTFVFIVLKMETRLYLDAFLT